MSRRPSHRRATRPRRLLGLAVGSLAALVWASTTPTLSGWTAGVVGNGTNSAGALSLAFSHAPGSGSTCSLGPRANGTAPCVGSVLPTTASAASAVTGTDAIANNGTRLPSGTTASVSAASCRAVQLANARSASAPLLPRNAVGFQTPDPYGATNAVSLGAGAFATAPVAETLQSVNGGSYGYGIWFKASAGQSGPLFSFDTNPAGVSGTADRTLTLNGNGTLTFATSGTSLSTTGTSYADGAWHFAYVTLADAPLSLTEQVSVDGVAVANRSGVGLAYSTPSGYWHLGWGAGATFPGSLSNFVVFASGAPAAPNATQRGSQAQLGLWASAGTGSHWLLGDAGTTPYTGGHPGGVNPCAALNITWSFAAPAATPVPSEPLASFADGADNPYTALPAAGATQTGTVTITRNATWTAYTAGLRLYVPVTWKVQSGPWSQSFTWSSAASVVLG